MEFNLSKDDVANLAVDTGCVILPRSCPMYPFEVHFAPCNHRMTLNDPWFDLVKRGQKRFEGRRMTPKMHAVRIGDTVDFVHHTCMAAEPFRAIVIGTRWFTSFEKALCAIGVDAVLPGRTVAEGVEVVSLETQTRDGVCMLELLVEND